MPRGVSRVLRMDISIKSLGANSPPSYCDCLDVTFDPECGLWADVSGFLACIGAAARRVSDQVLEYRLPAASWGNFQYTDSGRGWGRLSASGGSCEALRGISAFDEYLSLVGAYPHSVTRLDACIDFRVPAPPVIQSLVSRYPSNSLVYLTRKGVKPDYNLQPSLGGGLTGTFMAGPLRLGKSKVSARVYDKRNERIARTGEDPGPWLRYEITARKGTGATLRDASDPSSLFWHFASPALLTAPPGQVSWVPFGGESWAPGAVPRPEPYQRLRKCVEASLDIENMIRLADGLTSDGRSHLLRLIRNRLGLRDLAIA